MKYILAVMAICLGIGLYPSIGMAEINCGVPLGPCANTSIQAGVLLNTQTTGGAIAAVVVTIAAVVGVRAHIYHVEARCDTSTNTSGITITDGGTTIWSTVGTEVIAASNFVRTWDPGLTGATNSAVVITLAACAAGTGTLIVQADRW